MASVIGEEVIKLRQITLCEEGEIKVEIENHTDDDFEMYIGCEGSTVGAFMGKWSVDTLVRKGLFEWTFTAFKGYFNFNTTHQICFLFNKRNGKGSKFSIYGGTAPKAKLSKVDIKDDIVLLNDRNHAILKPLDTEMVKDDYYYKMTLKKDE